MKSTPVAEGSGGTGEDGGVIFLKGSHMSSFGLYLIGAIVLIGGLIYGAVLLHVQSQWIVVGAVILLGACILGAVTHTRQRDPAE